MVRPRTTMLALRRGALAGFDMERAGVDHGDGLGGDLRGERSGHGKRHRSEQVFHVFHPLKSSSIASVAKQSSRATGLLQSASNA